MRVLSLLLFAALAGCARPVSQAAAPTPMAAHCPMHAGGMQAMPGMAMAMPMAHDSAGASPTMTCPMCAQMHSGNATGAGCPMHAAGGCPMHRPAPPDSAAPHRH